MVDAFDTVHAFDWYDGVVLGLVQPVGSTKIHLASLLAFDPDTRRRAYALLELSTEDAIALTALQNAPWEEMVSAIRSYCARHGSEVTVVRLFEQGASVSNERVPLAVVADALVSGIDEAIRPDRRRWLTAR